GRSPSAAGARRWRRAGAWRATASSTRRIRSPTSRTRRSTRAPIGSSSRCWRSCAARAERFALARLRLSAAMGETRGDLQHLLEDLRDAYPESTQATILTQIVAHSPDSGATDIADSHQ